MDTVFVHILDKAESSYSWVPLASLAVAILASIAAIISPIMSRKTIKSQILSNSRQDWLNTVRLKVARHLQLTTVLVARSQSNIPRSSNDVEELALLEYELELLLNTSDIEQNNLFIGLQKSRDISIDKQRSNEYSPCRDTIKRDFVILREEVWNLIKKGK
jgi:hypothetical protein